MTMGLASGPRNALAPMQASRWERCCCAAGRCVQSLARTAWCTPRPTDVCSASPVESGSPKTSAVCRCL